MCKGIVVAIAAILFACFNGTALATSTESTKTTVRHEAGRKIYNFRCYYCHGYSGNAKTLAANFLTPRPRDFTATSLADISRSTMVKIVSSGKPGTPMKGFGKVISAEDIALVVDFVRIEFMRNKAINTKYHTKENGWPNHDRYLEAYPFATGDLPIDTEWAELSGEQQRGKRLFLTTCISCHDQARVKTPGPIWRLRPLSYPRNHYSHKQPDAISAASTYAKHDIPPKFDKLTGSEKFGESLFQKNCAFCHGADGTGRNWIGSFLNPKARDLTDSTHMGTMTRSRLRETINFGLEGTSMPAWKYVLNSDQIEALMDYINRAFHPISH